MTKENWSKIWKWCTMTLPFIGLAFMGIGMLGALWIGSWFWKLLVTGLIFEIPVVVKGIGWLIENSES